MRTLTFTAGTPVAAVLLALAVTPAAAAETVFTLYRNSVLDPGTRLHVATFDAAQDGNYNRDNCAAAADLFQRQQGVKTRFWCEPGRFKS